MTKPTKQELKEYATEADAWFAEHTPRDVGFMLPLTFMEVGTDQQFDFLRNWQRKQYEAGYLGAHWPKEYGGGGLHPKFQAVATKAMQKHNVPITLNAIGTNWAGPLLLDIGSEEHKKKYIKGILTAEDIWCQGFSEPDNGSDLGGLKLRAERDGDSYVLNGSKIWTTLGAHAKYMILLARSDPNPGSKYAGMSFILTPMDAPGISTQKIKKITGEHGFTQTFFENARIPTDGLVGAEGQGWRVAMQLLEYERGARAGQAGGIIMQTPDAFAIVDLARSAIRNGKPAIEDPALRDKLVDFIIDIHAQNLNQTRAKIPGLNSEHPAGLMLMNKLVFSEQAREISQFAMTLLGENSAWYVDEPNATDGGLWARSYLNAFSATIGGGTSEIQHNILAEHVLGLPKDNAKDSLRSGS
ncbi:MAG: acyl-CoA dehydrogenase [Robiginitomaculum sp.]|nr:MAG: acyl-CoA dehydrogenase [Robiginitomaculum sp.]